MGVKGWHRGILRSSAFQQMLDLVPDGVIQTGHEFESYMETDDGVQVRFKNGEAVMGDILVGADGIRSGVSRQAFGDPRLFHTGIRLYLAWCEQIPDVPPNYGVLHHNWQYQFSFFPTVHGGKPGFEWWIVEPSWEGKPVPGDIENHVRGILKQFPEPALRFADATNFDTQVYRWEIYNRPSMKKWSTGRIVCLGDAVHPVSPYAAYGMGMAIEDGYYLARALDGVDLRKSAEVTAGFCIYEGERVNYVNHNMEFARFLGQVFHGLPWPLAWVRDCIFDYTPFLSRMMKNGYLKKAEEETIGLKELQVQH
ncbi:FAD/NAD(P)-binding domain-containing protein, partial [Aureobasidium melanogenum]